MNDTAPPPATAPPPIPKPFSNPWLSVPEDQVTKTTLKVPGNIISRLAGLHPRAARVQTIASILIQKLINELDRQQFNTFDPSAFERAIDGLSITLGGGAIPGSNGINTNATGPNDSAASPKNRRKRSSTS